MKTHLLGIIGSLRDRSVTHCGVRHVLATAKRLGAEVEVIDFRKLSLPIFDPDNLQPPGFEEILKHVTWANTFVLGSPDYHGSMSGAMKNFLDYFWKELSGKLFGYICASHEKGLTAMDQLRTTVRQCYGWSLPYGVSLMEEDVDLNVGNVTNSKVIRRLNWMAYDLVTYGALLRKQFESDVAGNNPDVGFAIHYRKNG